MRADNHQILQPLYVSTLSDKASSTTSRGTGLGWKTDAKVDGKDTALPTTCKMERPNLSLQLPRRRRDRPCSSSSRSRC